MTILLTILFFSVGWFLIRPWYKEALFERATLALPVGMGVSLWLAQHAWFAGVTFDVTYWSWFFLALGSVVLNLRSQRFSGVTALLSKSAQSVLALISRRYTLIEAVLLMASAFSMLVIGLWSFVARPVIWDNLALYDFRAHVILDVQTFAGFIATTDAGSWFRNYDFIHPFLSTFLHAFVYKSGGQFPFVVIVTLFVSVLMHGFLRYKRFSARLGGLLLLTSTSLMLQNSTEGYAAWIALHFLLHALLLWKKLMAEKQPNTSQYYLLGILIAAMMTSRIFEPYWLFLIVMVCFQLWWRVRRILPLTLVALVPLVTFGQWQEISQTVRVDSHLQEWSRAVSTVPNTFSFTSVLSVLRPMIIENPITPYVALAMLVSLTSPMLFFRPKTIALRWLSIVFLGFAGMLYGGGLVLALMSGQDSAAFVHAALRGGLPVAGLAVLIICEALESSA